MARKKTINYQEMAAELDAILEALQTSEMDIDEAVKSYEHGMQLVKELEAYLLQAENKITKVKAKFDQQ